MDDVFAKPRILRNTKLYDNLGIKSDEMLICEKEVSLFRELTQILLFDAKCYCCIRVLFLFLFFQIRNFFIRPKINLRAINGYIFEVTKQEEEIKKKFGNVLT